MTEATSKKVVSRDAAIALGTLCVILAVALIGVIAYYTSAASDAKAHYEEMISIRDLDISGLQSSVLDLSDTIINLQKLMDERGRARDATISSLNSQVSNLNDIVNLEKETVWIDRQVVNQPQNDASFWIFKVDYAGYVTVEVWSSTSTTTYVEAIYIEYGVDYQKKIGVWASGTAIFPVLPGYIEIRIGNTEVGGATETVTITYTY